jgi:hypothetical protein
MLLEFHNGVEETECQSLDFQTGCYLLSLLLYAEERGIQWVYAFSFDY